MTRKPEAAASARGLRRPPVNATASQGVEIPAEGRGVGPLAAFDLDYFLVSQAGAPGELSGREPTFFAKFGEAKPSKNLADLPLSACAAVWIGPDGRYEVAEVS
jgi:hypothetical protein